MKYFPLKSPRHHLGFLRGDYSKLKNLNLPRLTKSEMDQLESTWPSLDFYQIDLIWNRVHKKFCGFSPYYLGAYQGDAVRSVYNPLKQLVSLENKAMCDVWFPNIQFPNVLVRCLNGVLYNKEMCTIDRKKAFDILKDEDAFIIKPSVDSMQGAGVIKMSRNQLNDIDAVFNQAGKNYIIQTCLHQEETIASLNPTSINCCRITSLYMNGKFDYSPMIKIGKKGSHVDNWHSSYLIGMSKNGVLFDVGYDKKLNVVNTTDNGIKFGGIKVPGFDRMIELVEKCHKQYFPHCGIIGWDIITNSNGIPTVVEVNLTTPGYVGEQLVSGAFFEPFVEEINYRLSQKK